ncbi:MAG TPA: DUF6580 family putative transport protein [Gemmataceae bacterium]|nr:DUF6580 family putative transport protein [Gemmataceae bacterium]
MGEPSQITFKPMTLALVGAGVLAASTALLPLEYRPWNFSAIGALALFAAARLGFWRGLGATAVALAIKEVGVYLIYGFPPYPLSAVYFTMYAAFGWYFLRKTESPLKIGTVALSASLLFFVVSNFVSWLEQAYPYGYSLAGLADCYTAAIPFYRGTLSGDLVFTGVLFAAHAVLSRAYFPAERVAVAVEARETEDRP